MSLPTGTGLQVLGPPPAHSLPSAETGIGALWAAAHGAGVARSDGLQPGDLRLRDTFQEVTIEWEDTAYIRGGPTAGSRT